MALRMSLRCPCGCIFTYAFPSDVVFQDHRGTIIEGIGCAPVIDNVTLLYLLVLVWVPFLSFVAAIYACLSFRTFLSLRRRNTTNQLFSSGYSISKDYYLRLMCFSLIPLLLTFPLTLFGFVISIRAGPQPWIYPISREDTHSNFNRFEFYSAAVIKANPSVYAIWVINLCACLVNSSLVIIFLGMNDEQRREYRRWFFVILRPFSIKPASSSTDSPTVWQWLCGRTTTTLTPTPFTLSGATASTSMSSVPHGHKGILNPTDVLSIERENFGLSDRKKADREESSNPREGASKLNRGDHKDAPGRNKDEKEKGDHTV